MNFSLPLANDTGSFGRSIRTTDYDECRARVREATGTHCLSVVNRSNFHAYAHYGIEIGRLSVDLVKVDADEGFEVAKERPNNVYYFQFLLQGDCRIDGLRSAVIAEPGCAFVIEPNQVTREVWSGKCLQLLVRVDRDVLEQATSAELGKKLSGRLTFQPVTLDRGIAPWLRQTIGLHLQDKADRSVLRDARVIRNMERMVLTMLLTGLPNSKSDELTSHGLSIAPHYVKRAEEYIRAHATDDLTMQDIVVAACVSERSLFYGFRKWRSTTPMAYVWDLRLELAHRELKRARQSGGTVGQVAINTGFSSFSHFSKMYKTRFGETPSETLRGLGLASGAS